MGASLIVAVRKALVAGVAALEPFDGLDVMYSYRGTTKREFAYTRDATFEHAPASMKAGPNFRKEVGRFEFVIWSQLAGGSPDDAGERALELGLAFEEWVAGNKQGVGGAFVLQVAGSGALREGQVDRAAVAELVYPVTYQARLT